MSITIEMVNAGNAKMVSDFIYRIYGYTYPHHSFYDSDQLAERHASGRYLSFAAIDDGTVAVLIVLSLGEPSECLGFMDLIASDPNFPAHVRAHAVGQLMARIKASIPTLRDRYKLRGLVSTETTTHQKTQRMMASSPYFSPCGLFLGWMPGWSERLRSDTGPEDDQSNNLRRNSTVSAFPFRSQFCPYVAHIPEPYRDLVRGLYQRFSLPVTLDRTSRRGGLRRSIVSSSVNLIKSFAKIDILQVGDDCPELLRQRLEHFRSGRIQLTHIAIPLREEDTDALVESLEHQKCRFAALLPGYFTDSDAIVLQYVNHSVMHLRSTDLISPNTQSVFEAITR